MGNDTARKDESFYSAIGRLVVSWGHLDLGLDCFVEILYHGYNGKSIEAEIPRALKRKLSFLRAIIRTLPIGDEAIRGYLNFFDRIQDAAQTRHNIIHGAVVEQFERSGEAVLVRTVRSKSGAVKHENKFTTENILAAALEAQELGGMALKAVNGLYDLFRELSQQHGEQKPS